jgi:hypothetical protein
LIENFEMASNWSRKLSEPVRTKSGGILRSLSDARDLILWLGGSLVAALWWTYATELLLKAAESGKRLDIKLATLQPYWSPVNATLCDLGGMGVKPCSLSFAEPVCTENQILQQ